MLVRFRGLTVGLFLTHPGSTLISSWILFGSLKGLLGPNLELCWNLLGPPWIIAGTHLDPFLSPQGSLLDPFWKHFGTYSDFRRIIDRSILDLTWKHRGSHMVKR